MFHRLLTGEFPFDTRDRQAIINWHLDEKHTIHGTGSSELNGILGKSLAVAPAARYQTCGALLNDLRAAGILCDAPAAAAPVAAPTVQGTHVENLLHLTRLTRQLMLRRPYDLLFAVFADYPKVIKLENGEYELPNFEKAARRQKLKKMGAKLVNPAEELTNESSEITAKGVALDHRLQHNINTLLTEAESLQPRQMSAMAYRGLAIGSSSLLIILCFGFCHAVPQNAEPTNVFKILILLMASLGILAGLAFWGIGSRKQLVDDIVHYLKRPQGSDMY